MRIKFCPRLQLNRKDNAGFALIVVLGVLSTLSVLAWSLAFMVRTEMKISSWHKEESKKIYIARAGLHHAAAIVHEHLADDANGSSASWWNNKSFYRSVKYGEDFFSIQPQLHGVVHSNNKYGLMDEESLLNINAVTPEMLMQFETIAAPLAERIVYYIKQKKGDRVSEDGKDKNEKALNSPIKHLTELLSVEGLSHDKLFGKQPDALAANLTCYSSGKVNVNSAKPMVLQALGFSEEEIELLLRLREQGEKYVFESVDSFFEALEIDQKRFEKIVPMLTVKSTNFRVASRVGEGADRVTIFARISTLDDTTYFSHWRAANQGIH